MKTIVVILIVLLVFVAWSCGARRGGDKIPPPTPVSVEAASCPSPIVGKNVRITNAIGESNSPVIVWSGKGFDLSWWDMRGRYPSVQIVKVDRFGVLRSPVRMMPHEGIAKHQQIAADSQDTRLVWMDEDAVMFSRLGLEEQRSVKLAKDAQHPAVGPWGAVAWVNNGRMFFRCDGMLPPKDKHGERLEPEPVILATGGIETPSIAWSGEHYGLAWSGSIKGGRQIMLQRVSNDGKLIGNPVKISRVAGISRKPTIIWTGREFAVTWTNAAPIDDNPNDRYRIFFAIIPAMGDTPRLTRQLEFRGTADQVALAWTGTEFAISWVGSKQPMGSAIYFQRLSADGVPEGGTVRVSDEKPFTCGSPALSWAGDGYGLTWHDDRESASSEVFFSFLKCGSEVNSFGKISPDAGSQPSSNDSTPVLKDVF